MPSKPANAAFPDTSWTLIEAVADGSHPQFEKAMETLADLYWPPVFTFLRKRGFDQEQAAELTQGFFADIVLSRSLFARADANRGQLRSLLLAALQTFLLDHSEREHTQKRGGQLVSLSRIEQESAMLQTLTGQNAHLAFDRRWALSVLHEALAESERYYNTHGKEKTWEAFTLRILHPSVSMTPPPSYAEIARMVGLPSGDEAGEAVRAVNARLQTRMYMIVGQTAGSDDQKAEFAYLMSLLGATVDN